MLRLFKVQLPSRQQIRMLVKEYFENVHPLRCYAFIHRPSFIQRLDESSNEDHARNGLLHVVCALGAKYDGFYKAYQAMTDETPGFMPCNTQAVCIPCHPRRSSLLAMTGRRKLCPCSSPT